jgi:hypothetical protein
MKNYIILGLTQQNGNPVNFGAVLADYPDAQLTHGTYTYDNGRVVCEASAVITCDYYCDKIICELLEKYNQEAMLTVQQNGNKYDGFLFDGMWRNLGLGTWSNQPVLSGSVFWPVNGKYLVFGGDK